MSSKTYYLLYKTVYQAGYIVNEFKTLSETTTYLNKLVNEESGPYREDSAKVLIGFDLEVS